MHFLHSTRFKCHDIRRLLHSAWYNKRSGNIPAIKKFEGAELEKLFIDGRVQTLLKALTGFKPDKLHPWRLSSISNRRHYALMTDNMYKEFVQNIGKRAQHFLQFAPMKEPRPNRAETISMNPEISGHDTYNMVFSDISFDTTNRDRTIVIREPNGRLRTALPEEQYRMHRIYYDEPNRPVKEPPVFAFRFNEKGHAVPGEALGDALSREEHQFVLDWACYFYEPDHPTFIDLCKCIFEKTIGDDKLHVLHLTRHFGPLAFYMLINGHLHKLLDFFATKGSIGGAANTIRLYRVMFPDWKTAISSGDSDYKVIQDYLKVVDSNDLQRLSDLLLENDKMKRAL